MLYLRKLPPWIGLGVGVFLWIAPTTASAFQSTPASYYDWGSYYQPKVLGFSAYAQEPVTQPGLPAGVEIPKPSYILPGNPFYFTKSFIEGAQTFVTFNQIDKQEKYLDLARERLAETYALANRGNTDLALESADRYRQQVETVNQSVQRLASQGVNIGDLANTIEKQKEPVIPDGLSASIQNLKNQGLITLEQSDKLYQLDSRGEVRGELEKLIDEGLFPTAEMVTLDQAVGESYPGEYQRSYETAKFVELKNVASFVRPDEETVRRLDEFKNNYKAGEPIPGEVRPYLYFLRSEEVARTVNFNLLPDGAEAELRNFYPESINANTTAKNPPAPPEAAGETPAAAPLPAGSQSSAQADARQRLLL